MFCSALSGGQSSLDRLYIKPSNWIKKDPARYNHRDKLCFVRKDHNRTKTHLLRGAHPIYPSFLYKSLKEKVDRPHPLFNNTKDSIQHVFTTINQIKIIRGWKKFKPKKLMRTYNHLFLNKGRLISRFMLLNGESGLMTTISWWKVRDSSKAIEDSSLIHGTRMFPSFSIFTNDWGKSSQHLWPKISYFMVRKLISYKAYFGPSLSPKLSGPQTSFGVGPKRWRVPLRVASHTAKTVRQNHLWENGNLTSFSGSWNGHLKNWMWVSL